MIQGEIETVKNQINTLTSTQATIHGIYFTISHVFNLTMIDGKTFSVIAESSTQKCGICEATPKIMNDLAKITQLRPKESLYEFGLSTLHALIRCFKCLLHIAYRLSTTKWKISSLEDKQLTENTKKNIIDRLKAEMYLLVDIPKPGYGTTNDGNTVRRFFQQPFLASSITGIDLNFIKRLDIILKTMACGYAVNVEAFREYTL